MLLAKAVLLNMLAFGPACTFNPEAIKSSLYTTYILQNGKTYRNTSAKPAA